jgi:hypothetical protein
MHQSSTTFQLIIALLCIFSGTQSCRTAKSSGVLRLDKKHEVHYLNIIEGGVAITTDQSNSYFDLVQPIEISIQSQKELSKIQKSRAELIIGYRTLLRNDVTEFNIDERKRIDAVMRSIYLTCERVAPGLFPNEIKLIRVNAEHYGQGVYYTRENCIVIPFDALEQWDEKAFTETMYHEVWHIISRYNPQLQKAAYALIGYTPIPANQVTIPTKLREHIIYNPDGVDTGWQIKLTAKDGTERQCMPILHTLSEGFSASKGKEFFGYLEFNLFPIKDGTLVTQADGISSPIKLGEEPSFYGQLTDNTSYIIHPDEVMADNFMFIMTTSSDVMKRQRFSKEGNALITAFEKLLAQPL